MRLRWLEHEPRRRDHHLGDGIVYVEPVDRIAAVVRIQDSNGVPLLRVTHDFHPAAGSGNLFEVTVTVENLNTTAIVPSYSRTLTWAGGLLDPGTLLVDPMLGSSVPALPPGAAWILPSGCPSIAPVG